MLVRNVSELNIQLMPHSLKNLAFLLLLLSQPKGFSGLMYGEYEYWKLPR